MLVIGGGPAGIAFAARIAMLGHAVTLVEQQAFPRRHVGQSLTPGAVPLLASIGIDLAAAAPTPVDAIEVCWDEGEQRRESAVPQSFTVERGAFDRTLLDRARVLGVRVIQPGRLLTQRKSAGFWQVAVGSDAGTETLTVDMIAIATGRGGAKAGQVATGPRTLAIHGWWHVDGARVLPRIEAGDEGWFWRVPLPDGTVSVLAFADARRFHGLPGNTLAERFDQLLGTSAIWPEAGRGRLIGAIAAVDATAWRHPAPVAAGIVRIGDAALAIDPLSSSGVQKSLQGALAAAIVANTMLRRPDEAGMAADFYATMLADAADRHARWAAGHYARVAAIRPTAFWTDRARGVAAEINAPSMTCAAVAAGAPVTLCPQARLVDTPCLDAAFVVRREALIHPAIDGPVAFLGGQAVAPLLRQLVTGQTPVMLARQWSLEMPRDRALAVTAWLLNNGVLVADEAARGAP